MTELSIWAKLDRARAREEIEAAHGSSIFDPWSALDKTRAAAQMTEALGVEFTPDDLANTDAAFAKIEAALSVSVDEDELVFADFVNGVYRLNRETVTVDDLFEFNASYGGVFDPDIDIGDDGLGTSSTRICTPTLTAEALALVMESGCTIVVEIDYPPGATVTIQPINLPDAEQYMDMTSSQITPETASNTFLESYVEGADPESNVAGNEGVTLGVHTFAYSIKADMAQAVSRDGEDVITLDAPGVEEPFNTLVLSLSAHDPEVDPPHLHSLKITSLKEDSELPALSA